MDRQKMFGARMRGIGALVLVLVGAAACAGPQQEQTGGRPTSDTADPLTGAITVKETQGCEAALPLLRRGAAFGRGFEILQFHLGDCLQTMAQTAGESERAALADEAREWFTKAALSGEPNAQGALAAAYFRGRAEERDLIEAAKWLLLYQDNPLRREIGARPLPENLEAEMRRTMSAEEWEEAQKRADAFVPVVQDMTLPDDPEVR